MTGFYEQFGSNDPNNGHVDECPQRLGLLVAEGTAPGGRPHPQPDGHEGDDVCDDV